MGIKSRIRLTKNYIQGMINVPKPLYNYNVPISGEYPVIYNAEGRPYDFFFIRDIHTAHNPYECTGKYFLWDRFNYGLSTHFYGHNAMLKTVGTPTVKYGKLTEARSIEPRDYDIFKKHPGLQKEFKRILAFDDEILHSVENSVFYPACAQVWYKNRLESDSLVWNEDEYTRKTKGISIISSNKCFCDLHMVRKQLALYCKQNQLADAYGTFDGGNPILVDDTLVSYRYSLAIENDISDYFFTEKITNCFAAQVVPIYLGARKISEFFNPDGIICVAREDLEPGNIEKVLSQCTASDYEARKEAILDNFERVKQYRNMNDYLYEKCL